MTKSKDTEVEKFVVYFIPETQAGTPITELRFNIQRLFNMTNTELDSLFCGQPTIIKSGADEDTASMYKRAIERSGGACWIQPEELQEDSEQMTA